MHPLSRRSGIWLEPPYRIWLSGSATVAVVATGAFQPQMIGAATLALTADATLNSSPNPLAGQATIVLVGLAALTKKPLSKNATLALSLGYSGTIFRGLVIALPAIYRAVYRAYVAKTGYSDVELPISSFQARRRDGEPSYLAITVPAITSALIQAINDRAGGQIILKSGFADIVTGLETLTELQRVDFDYFRYDLGPRSGSATLSGHRTTGAREPISRTLTGVSYTAVINGVRTIRCEPDMYLAPGDTAVWGDVSMAVGSISYTVNPTQAIMETVEAA